MSRANVTLKDSGPLTLTVGGRKFERGVSHTISDAAEIARFKIEPDFVTELLDGEPEAPPRARLGKPKRRDEDVDDEDFDDEGSEDEGGAKAVKPLTEDDMRAMNKKQLIEAADERGIEGLDPSATKADLIAKIVTAQKE